MAMLDPYGTTTISNAYQNLKMEEEKNKNTNDEIMKGFDEFIKNYRTGEIYKYRAQLQDNLNKEIYKMEFDQEDLSSFNQELCSYLLDYPAKVIPLFEEVLRKECFEMLSAKENIDLEEVPNVQFILNSSANPSSIRSLNSTTVNKLVIITGIIVSASKSQIKTSECVVQCRNCGNIKRIKVAGGFEQIQIPRMCESTKLPTEKKEKCPLDSYMVVPEKSKFIDVQTLKIQEAPEEIPVGEIPRTYLLYCDRYLVNKVIPGTRLKVIGIQCVDERSSRGNGSNEKGSYIRVIQFIPESTKSGRHAFTFSQDEEAKFNSLAKDKKIYEKISRSIAPAIFGCEDIKKAIACLLFGGCRKRLNEGVNLRGDLNILLVGDPGCAKSQFLKFVERVAPIAVYTSGKGSSAAGLTASIIKDPSSGEFQLEGGAMVLADGGIVCIDEFDKMRTQDRVAIHEAMEQQTISVAKAGITTTLNSRTSVLAAANPIYGHLDDLKSTQEQIDFQTTILSRFDCIFLVRDVHDAKRDEQMASHIVDINVAGKLKDKEGEISINDLKKYIAYARLKCTPKLDENSAETLRNFYVSDRKEANENKSKKGNEIPVTVRQLEAIIRLSESIAKMSLSSTVTKVHVNEAHRLFQISTLYAASSRMNYTYEIPQENYKDVIRIEEAIKRRISQGQRIQYSKLIDELTSKFSASKFVEIAVINLVRNGVLQYSEEKKILTRKK